MNLSAAFAFWFLSILLLPSLPWSATVQWGERKFTVADTAFEETPYLGIETLDSLFGIAGQWIPDRQKWVLKENSTGKTRSWVFTLDNAFCSMGDRVYNLTYPVRRGPQRLYVPLYPLLRLLKSEAQIDLAVAVKSPGILSAQKKTTASGSSNQANDAAPLSGPLILGPLKIEARSNGTLVTLETSAPTQPEIFFVPPNYLARFAGAKVASGTPLRQEGAGLVQQAILTADSGQVQLTLQLKGNVDTVEAEASGEGSGWQFMVRRAAPVAAGKSDKSDKAGKDQKAQASGKTDKSGKASKGTIIIDPGHGGRDQGAHVGGVNEAEITLAVGKLLKAELVKKGYKALLTREDDRYLSLADRPKFASENGGDLFISLHCNSIDGTAKRKKQVSGYVAYILREGASEEDKALARRENQAVLEEKGKTDKTEISPVDWILLEHQLNLYSKQSEDFTEKLIQSFEGFDLPKYGTGAGQAGFFVLVGAYMPAVLFEMGFLTNDRDRAYLSGKKGQKNIAQKLAEAVDRFMSYRKEG